MFFFQNLTAELFLLESPDDSYFPKSGGSTFLKTVGSHFSEICGNKITAYTVSHAQAIKKAEQEFEIYRQREMEMLESDFDREIKKLKEKN